MSKGRDLIQTLPELPLEALQLGGKLAHARRGPYLTIVPPARPAPAPPKPTASPALPHIPTPSFQTRKYWTQAIYPRVVCMDPGPFSDEIVLDATPDGGSGGSGGTGRPDVTGALDLAVLARHERHYKLSAFNGAKLVRPFWCTVKYGPWLAMAVETESCIIGAPNRWEFVIVEMPQVGMVWDGEWLDQPTLPNLTVIKGDLQMFNLSTSCCPGAKWCPTTQSCIPNQVNCGGTTPA